MTFLYKEADFKETSIGKIPKDWEIVDVGDILSLEYGKGLPERERISGEYPVVGSNGIVGYHNKALIKGPGIVIGRKGTIGAVSWVERDFWPIDTTYFVKLKKDGVDLKWLYYVLIKLDLPKLHLSDVVPGLKREIAYSLKIPFPSSLKEQRAIAGVLGVVDSVIAKTDEIIAKTERLKKGLMQRLLTRGIGHKEFKETEIGKIPKTWQVVKIEDVAETTSGGTPNRSKKEYYGGTIPWVKSGELKDNTIYDTEEKITELGLRNSAAKILPRGTLLVAMYGATVGKTAILGIEATTNQAVCAILPKDNRLNLKFLQYYIIFVRNRWILQSSGGAQPNISQEIIKTSKIPLPDPQEQKKIATILSIIDEKLEVERKEKAGLKKIKNGLMDLLLTGKVRVKVEVNCDAVCSG
jgi:type I restriction enzyme S subunit